MKLKRSKLRVPHLHRPSWKVFPILVIISLLTSVGYLAFAPATPAVAQDEVAFQQVSPNGFIDSEAEGRYNSYPWSMDVLLTDDGDYLYVGSNRDLLYGLFRAAGLSDEQITEIFGEDIPIPLGDDTDFCTRLFRCRVDDPANSWELVYTSPTIPTPQGEIPRDIGYRALRTFTDVGGETAVYVATTSLSNVLPCYLMKFGQDFNPGDEPEIVLQLPGANSVRALTVHNNKLDVSTRSDERWASDNPALGNWTQVAEPGDFPAGGVPAEQPHGISIMVSFDGSLYAFVAVKNQQDGFPGGFWAYKSNNPAIGNWEETMSYGAGNAWNEAVTDAKVFGDYVYVGTAIILPQHLLRDENITYLLQNWKGGDVLRFDSDDNWEMVIGNPDVNTLFDERVGNYGAGFDNPFNVYCWWMDVYQDELYLGTFDSSIFVDYIDGILKAAFPEAPEWLLQLIAQQLQTLAQEIAGGNPAGGDLWVTQDGSTWTPVTLDGFGDKYNYGVRTVLGTDAGLFVGMANPFYGAEVWELPAPTPAGGSYAWIAGPICGCAALGAILTVLRRRGLV